jgi:hypothetical protein
MSNMNGLAQPVVYGVYHNDTIIYIGHTIDFEKTLKILKRSCQFNILPKDLEYRILETDICRARIRDKKNKLIKMLKPEFNRRGL